MNLSRNQCRWLVLSTLVLIIVLGKVAESIRHQPGSAEPSQGPAPRTARR